jgi:hypothetical protein
MVDQLLITKIKKLLALATSSNENEASIAAEKASLLLAQYNLSLADLGTDEKEEISETIIETTSRTVTWKIILLSGIADANNCDAMRNNYTGNMFLVGSSTNLIVCQHLYQYLTQAIQRQAQSFQGKGRAYLNAFRVGCATRLRQRLLRQKEDMKQSGIAGNGETPTTPAIVVRSMFERNKHAIEDYLRQRGVKVKIRSASQVSSEEGFYVGYETGGKISLNQQMTSEKYSKTLKESS